MTNTGTIESIGLEFARALQPLQDLSSLEGITTLFRETGLLGPQALMTDPTVVLPANELAGIAIQLASRISALEEAQSSGNIQSILTASAALISGLSSVSEKLSQIGSAIEVFGTTLGGLTEPERLFLSEYGHDFRRRILHDQLARRLNNSFRTAYVVARTLGIVDERIVLNDLQLPIEASRTARDFRFDRALSLVARPQEFASQVFGWGTASFDGIVLFNLLRQILTEEFELPVQILDVSGMPRILEAFVFALRVDNGSSPPGLALSLRVPAIEDYKGIVPFGGEWQLVTDLKARFATEVEGLISPPFAVSLRPPSGTLALYLGMGIERGAGLPPRLLLGQEGGSRIEASEIGGLLQCKADLDPLTGTARFVPAIRGSIGGGKVILSPGSDGFLRSAFGGGPIEGTFGLGFSWNVDTGLQFEGSGGLSLKLSSNLTSGPVSLQAIGIDLTLATESLNLDVSATARAAVGPIDVLVTRFGIMGTISFPDNGGNLGPAQSSVGFLPPSGVGIAINAASVSGGGFLSFLADRYTGALQLKFNQIALSAFGVIDTKLPDGQEGFSFVILISADFQPIQLGLGFTLNGVGGLAGLNRTVNVEALREVVRKGTMDTLLFPKNPAADAVTIISTLSDVFPPAKDRHVFGPMAKIGWGTPTLIEGRLGLMLELPEPLRLTLLGTVAAELPKKKDAALVRLKMDVLGVLDFAAQSLAIDARLHDSQAGGFPISGDMAMRLRWGDQPVFALAVGGLNPNFEPPAGFPALERVRIDLGKGDNPSIGVSAYFAITSNTAQIGARAELKASGSGIDLHGWIGFDALFIFTPFQFVADFDAGVRVSFHGIGKSITLRGQVSGPGPYRVKGRVSVSVAFWDASLSFDKTFGKRQQISVPEVDPWEGNDDFPGLGKALADVRNWQSEPPADAAQVVSLRTRTRSQPAPSGQSDDLIGVDPMGTAMFRQRVVPLNQEITRFGSVPLKETRLYKVASVSIPNGSAAAGASLQELFAPGQYRTMKDAERISSPSFELMDAGFKLMGTEHAEGPRTKAPITYKTSFIGGSPGVDFPLPNAEMPKLVRRSAGARVGVDSTDLRRFVDRTAPRKITIDQPGWVVALRKSLQRYQAPATSYTTAATTLAKLIAQNEANRSVYSVFPAHEIDANEVP